MTEEVEEVGEADEVQIKSDLAKLEELIADSNAHTAAADAANAADGEKVDLETPKTRRPGRKGSGLGGSTSNTRISLTSVDDTTPNRVQPTRGQGEVRI